jgi:hypothetical protein
MSAHSTKTNSSTQHGLHIMRRAATQSALVLASLLTTTSLGFAVDANTLPHGGHCCIG